MLGIVYPEYLLQWHLKLHDFVLVIVEQVLDVPREVERIVLVQVVLVHHEVVKELLRAAGRVLVVEVGRAAVF